jgi:YD repeat-containing protein
MSSQHAGGTDKVAITYTYQLDDGSHTAVVTSSIGTAAAPATIARTYHIKVLLGVAKVDTIDQPCAGCDDMLLRTYDVNNNVLTSKDFNGKLTVFTYDMSRNLETSRVEASGTTSARTTTTTWHSTLRLPLKIAAPLSIVTMDYDAAGNLLTKSVQATSDATGAQGMAAAPLGAPRKWSYTYNEFGQLLSVTGPLSDTTTFSYDSQGNLASSANAAGHVTNYGSYDQSGRVGRITDPNGLVTELSYTPRGWLASSVAGTESTRYEYDGLGQLTSVTMPDGSALTYTYDPAHRLTGIRDSQGNNISYTLDLVGNRIGEQTADASGTLTRNISRVFDKLNRLQKITGAMQ